MDGMKTLSVLKITSAVRYAEVMLNEVLNIMFRLE